MSLAGSVTRWLEELQAEERVAVQKLWERYYRKLVALARARLGQAPRRGADEEDVALSAFDSFIRGAEQGRFPQLKDRHDLWQILVMITRRKAIDLLVHEGRRVEGQAGFEDGPVLRELISREPDPAFTVQVADECRRLFGMLHDEQLRLIAQRKLEGFTNQEIGAEMKMSRSTVERRLKLIRKTWADEEP
jgi:RNA polymerase sigma factor (sigma-70 family)